MSKTVSLSGSGVPEESQTTAREIARALDVHVTALRQRSAALKSELRDIENSSKEIGEEIKDAIVEFARQEVSSLYGERFDRLDALAQGVDALRMQSMSYVRDKAVKARDEALAELNAKRLTPISASDYGYNLDREAKELSAAQDKLAAAEKDFMAAQGKRLAWKETKEFKFVLLADKIFVEGGPQLRPAYRDYYEPKNMFSRFFKSNWAGDSYRQARVLMAELGHHKNGKDVFVDVRKWREHTEALKTAMDAATRSKSEASRDVLVREAAIAQMRAKARIVLSDEAILEKVRAKVVAYFDVPAFTEAVVRAYGSALPRNMPVLVAKVSTLGQLRKGVERTQEELAQDLGAAAMQSNKFSRFKPYQVVSVNLKALRTQQERRTSAYDRFASAAKRARGKTVAYVPVDNAAGSGGSSFDPMDAMLLLDLLFSNQSEESVGERGVLYQPVEEASAMADLMGVSGAAAAKMGLPEMVVTASGAVSSDEEIDFNQVLADVTPEIPAEPVRASSGWNGENGGGNGGGYSSIRSGGGFSPSPGRRS